MKYDPLPFLEYLKTYQNIVRIQLYLCQEAGISYMHFTFLNSHLSFFPFSPMIPDGYLGRKILITIISDWFLCWVTPSKQGFPCIWPHEEVPHKGTACLRRPLTSGALTWRGFTLHISILSLFPLLLGSNLL